MSTKIKVIIASVALISAFGMGRFTVPEKVKIETKIVEVEKKNTKSSEDTKKRIVTRERIKPNGEKIITKIETDEKKSTTKTKETKNTDTASTKETTRGDGKVTISALGGFDFRNATPVYGAHVSKPVLGPFTFGLFALSNPTVGASLGIQF